MVSFKLKRLLMKFVYLVMLGYVVTSACAQRQDPARVWITNDLQVGGPCEGCEAALEYGTRHLSWVDTMPDYHMPGPKIEVSGVIYASNGITPAKDVILYVYHTDQTGVYPTLGDETGWGKRHGYLRTWLKTNAQGQYAFYTLRPASYPGRTAPAHIHATIKEPDKSPYWIDEYLFDDDPILSREERSSQQQRGGNGILVTADRKEEITHYRRDIILGKNVPGYPQE
jgi:protocatechuate 3,4-dioxygenase beta subunit